jgi:hypothetical protein
MANFIADKHYYVDESKSTIVDESNPRAAFLLVAKGHELSEAEARRYGLIEGNLMEAKANANPPENKAHLSPSENKATDSVGGADLSPQEPEAGKTTAKPSAAPKGAQKPKAGK